MPTLQVTNFNLVVSVLGGWISGFGLVSFLLKEKCYMSEASISLFAGLFLSRLDLIRPEDYTETRANLDEATLAFTRLVLGVQLVLCGVQLPKKYIWRQKWPLFILIGGVMSCMWIMTSLLVWALVPGLPFLHALAVGSCVTPTDPILSAVIVKGKFADEYVPKKLQHLIVAESGLNDGLGYPFLCFALYLIRCWGHSDEGGIQKAAWMWIGEMWGYTILFSIFYGVVVGFAFQQLLGLSARHKFIDRESFLVFAISLALFIVGTCGMLGSDDVLACFFAGCTFAWDGGYQEETMEDSLQPTIDMLLNVSIFMWYGAMCPWHKFVANDIVAFWRLLLIGILVLTFRRLPFVFAVQKSLSQIESRTQALFMGFFGPIGVSAIFYLYVADEYVRSIKVGGEVRPDVEKLPETIYVVVWFLCICSIVVHGLSIPVGKFTATVEQGVSRLACNLRSTKHGEGFGGGEERSGHWVWKLYLDRATRGETFSDPALAERLLGRREARDSSADRLPSPSNGPDFRYMGPNPQPSGSLGS